MSARADADYEECTECHARIPLAEIQFPEDEEEDADEGKDANTQFGWLAGRCPHCGADLQLAYDRVRNIFLPPS